MTTEMLLTKALSLLWRCGTILRILSENNPMIKQIDDFSIEVQTVTNIKVTQ